MNRRFVLVTLVLTATAAFLVGLIVAGSLTPSTAQSAGGGSSPLRRAAARAPALPAGGINFADIAERSGALRPPADCAVLGVSEPATIKPTRKAAVAVSRSVTRTKRRFMSRL